MVLILAVPTMEAQDKKKDWKDRWKAEKIAYITDAMELTSAEAEKFWPIYNKCECEKKKSFKIVIDAYKALEEALQAGKNDNEINNLLNKYLEVQNSARILIVNTFRSIARFSRARRWQSYTSPRSHSAASDS